MELDSRKVRLSMVNACISNKSLARRAGVSVGTVNRILRKNSKVNTDTLGKLSKALNIPPASLLKE
ncbi:MAG: helix-turn-helix transcriptional regulator [Selenomonadaceae bacterium]|nr:helix-turn-helix transcriptional regulator [Selenomonadaceae bacterium]MBO6305167.1 helix-turn-helix transcriptional regulator [Selenomonadaceae bacterium]